MLKKNAMAGLALTTILLAIVLLAAIAVTIAMSSRSGNASSATQQDKLVATTLLNEAQQLKTNVDFASSNGVDPNTITASVTAPVTKFYPSSANIPEMVFPRGATVGITGNWYWHGASSPIMINSIGSSAGSLLIEAVQLTQGVCQQINLGLFGSTNIPTVATSGWDITPVGDTSNDPALAGQLEGCFYYAPYPEFFYYKVIVIR